MESWGVAVYKEIIAPEKIVSIDHFPDAEQTWDRLEELLHEIQNDESAV